MFLSIFAKLMSATQESVHPTISYSEGKSRYTTGAEGLKALVESHFHESAFGETKLDTVESDLWDWVSASEVLLGTDTLADLTESVLKAQPIFKGMPAAVQFLPRHALAQTRYDADQGVYVTSYNRLALNDKKQPIQVAVKAVWSVDPATAKTSVLVMTKAPGDNPLLRFHAHDVSLTSSEIGYDQDGAINSDNALAMHIDPDSLSVVREKHGTKLALFQDLEKASRHPSRKVNQRKSAWTRVDQVDDLASQTFGRFLTFFERSESVTAHQLALSDSPEQPTPQDISSATTLQEANQRAQYNARIPTVVTFASGQKVAGNVRVESFLGVEGVSSFHVYVDDQPLVSLGTQEPLVFEQGDFFLNAKKEVVIQVASEYLTGGPAAGGVNNYFNLSDPQTPRVLSPMQDTGLKPVPQPLSTRPEGVASSTPELKALAKYYMALYNLPEIEPITNQNPLTTVGNIFAHEEPGIDRTKRGGTVHGHRLQPSSHQYIALDTPAGLGLKENQLFCLNLDTGKLEVFKLDSPRTKPGTKILSKADLSAPKGPIKWENPFYPDECIIVPNTTLRDITEGDLDLLDCGRFGMPAADFKKGDDGLYYLKFKSDKSGEDATPFYTKWAVDNTQDPYQVSFIDGTDVVARMVSDEVYPAFLKGRSAEESFPIYVDRKSGNLWNLVTGNPIDDVSQIQFVHLDGCLQDAYNAFADAKSKVMGIPFPHLSEDGKPSKDGYKTLRLEAPKATGTSPKAVLILQNGSNPMTVGVVDATKMDAKPTREYTVLAMGRAGGRIPATVNRQVTAGDRLALVETSDVENDWYLNLETGTMFSLPHASRHADSLLPKTGEPLQPLRAAFDKKCVATKEKAVLEAKQAAELKREAEREQREREAREKAEADAKRKALEDATRQAQLLAAAAAKKEEARIAELQAQELAKASRTKTMTLTARQLATLGTMSDFEFPMVFGDMSTKFEGDVGASTLSKGDPRRLKTDLFGNGARLCQVYAARVIPKPVDETAEKAKKKEKPATMRVEVKETFPQAFRPLMQELLHENYPLALMKVPVMSSATSSPSKTPTLYGFYDYPFEGQELVDFWASLWHEGGEPAGKAIAGHLQVSYLFDIPDRRNVLQDILRGSAGDDSPFEMMVYPDHIEYYNLERWDSGSRVKGEIKVVSMEDLAAGSITPEQNAVLRMLMVGLLHEENNGSRKAYLDQGHFMDRGLPGKYDPTKVGKVKF